MPTRVEVYSWNQGINEEVRSVYVEATRKLLRVVLAHMGISFVFPDEVLLYNSPGDRCFAPPMAYVTEWREKLAATVTRGSLRRTIDGDGATAIISGVNKLTTVTIYQAGGPYDSGDQPGPFSSTTIVP